MKIGIPRALLYYYYFPLWQTFLQELGHEVIVSGQTNKAIVNQGAKTSVPEICVPIKIYNGHILELAEKTDYIFTPRMISIESKTKKTFCPKFLGLPDMLRYTFPQWQDKFIAPHLEGENDFLVLPEQLKKATLLNEYSEKEIKSAWQRGISEWKAFRDICRRGYRIDEALEMRSKKTPPAPVTARKGRINIALIGYVYNIYDQFVGMDIAKKLEAAGANVYTFEMLNDAEIRTELKPMRKTMFWTFSDKIFASGLHYYKRPEIDGIIHLTAFGCGPDSLIGKMLELDSIKYGKPFLTIRVDEHSGESHLQTRIEAFSDMLWRKKRGANVI